jgi:hypothetical protein
MIPTSGVLIDAGGDLWKNASRNKFTLQHTPYIP